MKLTLKTVNLLAGETVLLKVSHGDGKLDLVVHDQYIECSNVQTRIAEEIKASLLRKGKMASSTPEPGTTYILLHSNKERASS